MQNQFPPQGALIAQLLFLLIMCIPLVVLIYSIGKRKGKSAWYALLGFLPGVNGIIAIWFSSLPDIALLQRIAALERKSPPILQG